MDTSRVRKGFTRTRYTDVAPSGDGNIGRLGLTGRVRAGPNWTSRDGLRIRVGEVEGHQALGRGGRQEAEREKAVHRVVRVRLQSGEVSMRSSSWTQGVWTDLREVEGGCARRQRRGKGMRRRRRREANMNRGPNLTEFEAVVDSSPARTGHDPSIGSNSDPPSR